MTQQTERDLASLLTAGERAAFHGPPAAAVESLRAAVNLACDEKRDAEASAATWLLGVSLAASGRYGAALNVLDPLLPAPTVSLDSAELRLFGGLAAATVAGVHRQLGRHAEACEHDASGLEVCMGGDGAGLDAAVFDCRLGLATDAVGVGGKSAARRELASAAEMAEGHRDWWRQRVRLDWTRAELALLDDDPAGAVEAAAAAVGRAELARAPRHVAKGLLFMGVAQTQAGADEAVSTLRRAATLAEQLVAVPLVWPARAMLGALVGDDDPVEGARCLQAARAAVVSIASDLPPSVRQEWFGRPDIEALLSA